MVEVIGKRDVSTFCCCAARAGGYVIEAVLLCDRGCALDIILNRKDVKKDKKSNMVRSPNWMQHGHEREQQHLLDFPGLSADHSQSG